MPWRLNVKDPLDHADEARAIAGQMNVPRPSGSCSGSQTATSAWRSSLMNGSRSHLLTRRFTRSTGSRSIMIDGSLSVRLVKDLRSPRGGRLRGAKIRCSA